MWWKLGSQWDILKKMIKCSLVCLLEGGRYIPRSKQYRPHLLEGSSVSRFLCFTSLSISSFSWLIFFLSSMLHTSYSIHISISCCCSYFEIEMMMALPFSKCFGNISLPLDFHVMRCHHRKKKIRFSSSHSPNIYQLNSYLANENESIIFRLTETSMNSKTFPIGLFLLDHELHTSWYPM